jgi:succinate dehydrogenase / fumarate reductase membrane anchor subunit
MMRDQKLWAWHLIAGAVILVFLGVHMMTMHMEGVIKIQSLNPASVEHDDKDQVPQAKEGKADEAEIHPIDWANVRARGVRTLYMVSYIVLLGAALFHGLYGLRNILFELNPAVWLRKTLSALLLLLGFGLFIYGTWAAVVARGIARAFKA